MRNRMILISHLSPLAPFVTEPKVSAESSSESLTLRPWIRRSLMPIGVASLSSSSSSYRLRRLRLSLASRLRFALTRFLSRICFLFFLSFHRCFFLAFSPALSVSELASVLPRLPDRDLTVLPVARLVITCPVHALLAFGAKYPLTRCPKCHQNLLRLAKLLATLDVVIHRFHTGAGDRVKDFA